MAASTTCEVALGRWWCRRKRCAVLYCAGASRETVCGGKNCSLVNRTLCLFVLRILPEEDISTRFLLVPSHCGVRRLIRWKEGFLYVEVIRSNRNISPRNSPVSLSPLWLFECLLAVHVYAWIDVAKEEFAVIMILRTPPEWMGGCTRRWEPKTAVKSLTCDCANVSFAL